MSERWFIHLTWACGLVFAVGICAAYTAKFNIEDTKQNAFMMKACVDANGQWKRDGWSAYYICVRPKGGDHE